MNGYEIMDSISETQERISILKTELHNSIKKFEGEIKRPFTEISKELENEYKNLALYQDHQVAYNTKVEVVVDKEEGIISLQEATKLVGLMSHLKEEYKRLLSPGNDYISGFSLDTRDKEKEYAKPNFTKEEVKENLEYYSNYVSQLKRVIREGNRRDKV